LVRSQTKNSGVVMNPVDHPMGGGEGRAQVDIQDQEKVCLLKDIKPGLRRKHQQSILLKDVKNN
jgi:ribosomal protein L2